MKKLKWKSLIAAVAVFPFLISACSVDITKSIAAATAEAARTEADTATTAADIVQAAGADDVDLISVSYSDTDKDDSYDERSATKIALADDMITVDGEGADAQDSAVTITAAGEYILSGTLSEGQIIVDTDKADTVKLVLDDVSVSNSSGSAALVRQAKKTVITLTEGTDNVFSAVLDSETDEPNEAEGDVNDNAAVFAEDDLTINGAGKLTIIASGGHGIKTVDDLVITGGTMDITADKEGLHGKDSVAILDGNITIDAGEDGIKSTNSDDKDSGFVSINGGSIGILAEENGISAETVLLVTDGALTITAEQDTLHSNGSMKIEDGTLTLSAGDDGVHADDTLWITDGNMTVSQSYEGLEGANVLVSGGVLMIFSQDDGINAAGGSDDGDGGADVFGGTGDHLIAISGGYTYIGVQNGDGVDSNGDIEITGGTLVVDGPSNDENAAIDIGKARFSVSGGTLAAVGSAGMLVVPTEATQPVITVVFDAQQKADRAVTLMDSEGNILLAVQPDKAYQSVMLAGEALSAGGIYQIAYGGTLSGTSLDGAFYSDTGLSGASQTIRFALSDTILTIDQNGDATTVTN